MICEPLLKITVTEKNVHEFNGDWWDKIVASGEPFTLTVGASPVATELKRELLKKKAA